MQLWLSLSNHLNVVLLLTAMFSLVLTSLTKVWCDTHICNTRSYSADCFLAIFKAHIADSHSLWRVERASYLQTNCIKDAWHLFSLEVTHAEFQEKKWNLVLGSIKKPNCHHGKRFKCTAKGAKWKFKCPLDLGIFASSRTLEKVLTIPTDKVGPDKIQRNVSETIIVKFCSFKFHAYCTDATAV